MDSNKKCETLKILVVDDHKMMRTMIKQNLQSIGCTDTETANDGNEALEKN